MDVRCERVETVLPDEAAFAAASAALPGWRRRKCAALRFEADRRRSVAAWELLRRMMSEEGVRAEILPVSENVFGKPAFDPSVGIHFSLSHSAGRVMAAVSDRPIGCDVERITPFDESLARECLTDAERELLGRLRAGQERDAAFVRLWVRKESRAKAFGRGFDPKTVSGVPEDFPSELDFRDFDFGDGHLGCVAFLV